METLVSRRTIAHLKNIINQTKSKLQGSHYYRWSCSCTSPYLNVSAAPRNSNKPCQALRIPHSALFTWNSYGRNRLLHSLQRREEDEEEEEREEESPVNEFLERFVTIMRSKLSEAYPEVGRDMIDGMVEMIVNKVVEEMEKGTFHKFEEFASNMSSPGARDFSQELWKTVWEVSNAIVEDMRKADLKKEIQSYLQSQEMKEISDFAKDVGITGDLLRDLKMHFADKKKSELEFYRSLDRLTGRDSTANLIGIGGASAPGSAPLKLIERIQRRKKSIDVDVDVEGVPDSVEKPSVGLPQRRAKLKFEAYGLQLLDQNWTEISQKLEVAEKKICPEEPAMLSGKAKAITKQILSLTEDEDPSDLLAQWMENFKPRRVDWLALLHQLDESKKDLYFKATEFALSKSSFEASARDYTKLLDAYAREDRFPDAERILQNMVERGFARDAVTCSVLIHMYSKLGNLDRAREAFDEIRTLGLQPDQKAYSLMIMAYVKAGLPKAGESLMREMEAKDIKPGKEIYLALLRAFAQRGHVDGAQRIFNTMQFAGIMPSLESCTLLVEAYGQSGDPDQARNVFDHMMKAGHKPDDKCTATLLAAYEKKNFLDKALSLLLDLEKDGFKPGIETSAIMIDWLGKLGLLDEAEQVFEEIAANEEVPSKVRISLCDMYAREGLQQKALDTLSFLESNIETVDSEGFERLIHGFLAGGLTDEAKRMHDLMQNRGLVPSEPVKVALMAAQAFPRKKPAGK